MANFTPNVNLEKPLGSEHYLIPKFNANMDKIDTKFGELQNLGVIISGATAKTTPIDADTVALSDSTATGALKKLSWLNIKATLKTYFDTLYQSILVSGTNIKTINGNSVLGSGDLPITSGALKNWIINGMFDVWQRGTSQTSSGYGSDDRWTNEHANSTKTNSRQSFAEGQTDVPNNPTYFNRTVVSSVAGAGNFVVKAQKLEDVRKLAGKTVTISFWAKADSNKNLAIDFTQVFGGGGSVSVSGIGTQKFALTSSWQKFTKTVTLPSISGKTVGTDSHTGLRIWFDAGSSFNAQTDSLGNQSGTFDIANVSLVEGSVAVECQNQPYADVLRECQRYYCVIDANKAGGMQFKYANSTEYWANLVYSFKVSMRKPPNCSYSQAGSFQNCTHNGFVSDENVLTHIVYVASALPYRAYDIFIIADAEL